MKQLSICIMLLLLAEASYAMVLVEWSYIPPSEPAVTGFRLYHNGTQAQEWMTPDATTGYAEITPVVGDSFTLTALFDDDSEAPHSFEYFWTGEGGGTIRIIRIITFAHWLWFAKPGQKHVRVGETGLKGARIR